jgi:hypothetical protein
MAKKQKKIAKNFTEEMRSIPGGSGVISNTYIMVAVFFLLLLVPFSEVIFTGKTLLPPDMVNSSSFQPFVDDAVDSGTYPLWTPLIFSGMPSFPSMGSIVSLEYGIIRILRALGASHFWLLLFYYWLLAVLTFFLLRRLNIEKPFALLGGLILIFQPHLISFAAFGHTTKLTTAAMLPVTFLFLKDLLEKQRIRDLALLALTVGFLLLGWHAQFAYYTLLMLGCYWLYWLVNSLRDRLNGSILIKGTSLASLALVLGVALSSWAYLSIYEYSHFSIRGGGASGGLDYGYATSWSFSPLEMTTFIIPSFVGFGGQTYWGDMPFTDYPLYMGVVPLFLAGLALVVNRNRLTIFFAILAVLSLLVSFGQHFPVLYAPLFKLLPFFNKFRIPSMIQILLEFSVVILAASGLQGLLKTNGAAPLAAVKKYVYVFGGVCLLLALIVILGESSYTQWVVGAGKGQLPAVAAAAHEMAMSDAFKMLFLLAGVVFLVFSFLRKKLSGTVFGGLMVVLVLIDLWSVDFKMINPRPVAEEKAHFLETEAVRFLKQQEGPFRVYPVLDNKNPNWYAYHNIQSIYGYHAAKLKIYQNFMNQVELEARNQVGLPQFLGKYYDIKVTNGRPGLVTRAPENLPSARKKVDDIMLKMLNVKYLISLYPIPDPDFKEVVQAQPSLYEYTGAFPRAWFVDEVTVVPDDNDFYRMLRMGEFDPRTTAVLAEEPEQAISPTDSQHVEVTSFGIHEIELDVRTANTGQLVLSEIYYPAGWNAYIDGEKTKIYQTNAILRSIQVPPGQHNVRFVFEPAAFTTGIWISITTFAVLVFLFFYDSKIRSRRLASNQGEPEPATA